MKMMRSIAVLSLLSLSLAAGCSRSRPEVNNPIGSAAFATPEQVDTMWARSKALLADRKWSRAAQQLERVQLEMQRSDQRLPEARLLLGDARLGLKSALQAVREYRRVADDFPNDTLAPEGLLRAGDAYLSLWRRVELDPTYGIQARATYQEVVARYPQSPVAATARLRTAEIDDRMALKSFQAAEFYLRYKLYDSGILYLKDLVTKWPQSDVVPKALQRLVETYRQLGYAEDVTEICGYFRATRPDAPNFQSTCPEQETGSEGTR